MAKNIEKVAAILGAKIVAQVPETGGGAFGAYRLAEIVGRRLDEIMDQDMFAVRRPFVARALAGETVSYEAEFVRSGRTLQTELVHVPHREEDGRVVGMYSVVQDVTARKLSEKVLAESEARFRSIANSAPVPMWVTRLGGRREFINRAYQDFLAVSYDEAVNFDWRNALHPDDLPRILQPFHQRRQRRAGLVLEQNEHERGVRSDARRRVCDQSGEDRDRIRVPFGGDLAETPRCQGPGRLARREAPRRPIIGRLVRLDFTLQGGDCLNGVGAELTQSDDRASAALATCARLPHQRDQIGDRTPVLADGQARQLDPGRLEACLGFARIKGFVDIGGDRGGFIRRTFVFGVLGHGPGDKACQLHLGSLAGQWMRVLIAPIAGHPVTRRAALGVNLCSIAGKCRNGRQQ